MLPYHHAKTTSTLQDMLFHKKSLVYILIYFESLTYIQNKEEDRHSVTLSDRSISNVTKRPKKDSPLRFDDPLHCLNSTASHPSLCVEVVRLRFDSVFV